MLLTAIVPPHDDEEVHRARLGDLVAKQPEALVVAELRGVLLRLERGCVVERELVPARASGPCADVLLDGEEVDRARAAEEGTRRAQNNVQGGMIRRCDSQGYIEKTMPISSRRKS